MKYISLPFKIKIFQFVFKIQRKLKDFINNRNKSNEVRVLFFNKKWDFRKIKKEDISIKLTKPPIAAYMFFPLGKGPCLNESFCFVGFKNNRVCGWAWLHNGMRTDTAIAHNLSTKNNVLWLGPDYVGYKYRGNSIQKLLIQARLEFIRNNLNHNYDIMTLVGVENIASLKSYNYFNFHLKK